MKIKNKKRFVLILSGVVVVLAIAGGIIAGQINKPLPYEFIIAKKQSVVQEVSVTGKVKPAQSVDLAFEKEGQQLELSYKILQLRKKQKLSQEELAKKLNTTQSVVARIEAGNQNFTIETLQKIASAFKHELKIDFIG